MYITLHCSEIYWKLFGNQVSIDFNKYRRTLRRKALTLGVKMIRIGEYAWGRLVLMFFARTAVIQVPFISTANVFTTFQPFLSGVSCNLNSNYVRKSPPHN